MAPAVEAVDEVVRDPVALVLADDEVVRQARPLGIVVDEIAQQQRRAVDRAPELLEPIERHGVLVPPAQQPHVCAASLALAAPRRRSPLFHTPRRCG